jgi:hypothetical protein
MKILLWNLVTVQVLSGILREVVLKIRLASFLTDCLTNLASSHLDHVSEVNLAILIVSLANGPFLRAFASRLPPAKWCLTHRSVFGRSFSLKRPLSQSNCSYLSGTRLLVFQYKTASLDQLLPLTLGSWVKGTGNESASYVKTTILSAEEPIQISIVA